MEEQINKTKSGSLKHNRKLTAIAGLVVFVVAVAVVTVLTLHGNNNNDNTIKTAVIKITSTGFQPATVSVQKGTKVVWESNDAGLHEVVANPYPKGTDLPNLKSQILNQNQTYTYTAN